MDGFKLSYQVLVRFRSRFAETSHFYMFPASCSGILPRRSLCSLITRLLHPIKRRDGSSSTSSTLQRVVVVGSCKKCRWEGKLVSSRWTRRQLSKSAAKASAGDRSGPAVPCVVAYGKCLKYIDTL